jgi:hypothetical protein
VSDRLADDPPAVVRDAPHGRRARHGAVVVFLLLAASASSLAAAPILMPDGYSWVSNTTSESAAQGVEGAWLARLGFLSFGFAVLVLTGVARGFWGPWATACHRAFGVLMISAAAFSSRHWDSDVDFDRTEDVLHSVSATAMGFAFAFGVVAVLLRRPAASRSPRVMDVIALASSVLLPVGMGIWGDQAGLLQRALFLVAYAWFGMEAWRAGFHRSVLGSARRAR